MPESKPFVQKYEVVEYDPQWLEQFQNEKKILSNIFGDALLSVEHIGSTSVPGLSAKPILDILVTVNTLKILSVFRSALMLAGYKTLGSYVMPNSELFVKEECGVRKINLHVFPNSHPHVKEMLLIRDYFRSHPQAVKEYAELKRLLVAKYPNDYSSYRREKDLWMKNFLKTLKEEQNRKVMTSQDVADMYEELARRGIRIWIDGGWAVDALLGKETRVHGDLDIAIQYKDVPMFRSFLESHGWSEVERDEEKKWNFVLGDGKGREIDVHAFTFGEDGHIVESDEYPEGSLSGTGTIGGIEVRCVAPEHLIAFHLRHEPREKDYQDVVLLCEKFGIECPREYERVGL